MEFRRLRTALLAGSGLALIATAPALAQQKDCAQRLDQIEEQLAKVEVDSQRQSDINEVVKGARLLAESGDERGCMNVVAELDDLMTTLEQAGQPQTDQGSEQAQASQQQGQASPQNSQSGQEVGEADMESLQPEGQQGQAQREAQAGSEQPQAGDQQQAGAQQPPTGEQKQAQTRADEQQAGEKGAQEMTQTGADQPQAGKQQAQGQAEVTARVAIEQPQPQVVVRQKPPKITVHIPKPVITVRLPQPEVQVQMPDPEVQVEQADPDIQVVMGQPDVQLQDSATQSQEGQQPVKADVQFEREQQQQAEIDVQMEDPEVRVEQEDANVEVAEGAPGAEQQQLTEGQQQTAQGGQQGQQQAQAGEQQQLAEVDREFATKAAEGGLKEVRFGELAQQQAESQEVQQFGRRMVEDHGQANEQLQQIAQNKDIELPQEMSDEAQQKYEELQQKSGQEFDQAYMDEMVSDHQEDIDAFQQYVDDGQDPDLTGFAEQTMPVLQEHLQLAQQTQEQAVAAAGQGKQSGQEPQKEQVQVTDENPLAAMPASDVIGAEVKNQEGDTVAEIVDLVKHQGQDDLFAVLSVGGFLGIGDKEVVVPVNELQVSQDGEIVMVNASEDQLKQMPEYQKEGYESTAQVEQAPVQQQ